MQSEHLERLIGRGFVFVNDKSDKTEEDKRKIADHEVSMLGGESAGKVLWHSLLISLVKRGETKAEKTSLVHVSPTLVQTRPSRNSWSS